VNTLRGQNAEMFDVASRGIITHAVGNVMRPRARQPKKQSKTSETAAPEAEQSAQFVTVNWSTWRRTLQQPDIICRTSAQTYRRARYES
jgi:hypothetical protein